MTFVSAKATIYSLVIQKMLISSWLGRRWCLQILNEISFVDLFAYYIFQVLLNHNEYSNLVIKLVTQS